MSRTEQNGQTVGGTIGDLALKKARGGKKASLPEVLDNDDMDESEKMDVTMLLESGMAFKSALAETTVAFNKVKEKLGEIAASNGLEGLRHGKIVYTQRLQDGRETLDPNKFAEELLARGVKADVIQECVTLATKQGESYWVREISELKP